MTNLTDICVTFGMLSSKYQPHACGEISHKPRSRLNLPISGRTLKYHSAAGMHKPFLPLTIACRNSHCVDTDAQLFHKISLLLPINLAESQA